MAQEMNSTIEQAKGTPIKIRDEAIEIKDMYLPYHNSEERVNPITHVMIHFSSNVTEKPQSPYEIEDIYTILAEYGLSAHFVIDRDGTIYRFVSENRVAYHAGKGSLAKFPSYENNLNDYSIGIELLAIGTKKEMQSFISEEVYDSLPESYIGYTDDQYKSLRKLLNSIHDFYPTIPRNRDHVIGHDEYAPDRKNDPGALFDWSRLGY